MSILSIIIKREFLAKVKNKTFIIMTFVSPLIFVVIAAVVAFLSQHRSEATKVAIHDETGWFQPQFVSDKSYEYLDGNTQTLDELREAVKEEKINGALFIKKLDNIEDYKTTGVEYISEDSPSMSFISDVEYIISRTLTDKNRVANGIDTLKLKQSNIDVSLNLQKTTGEEALKGINEIKIGIGSVLGYLIMMFIIVYGNLVMRSVIEEKTSRIVEVIVSSVKPKQLMMGKIIGSTLAALLQFSIWVVIGGILYFVVMSTLGVNISDAEVEQNISGTPELADIIRVYIKEILSLPLLSIIVSFLIYFVGGYALYSSVYAAIGAAVDNETDSQQFMLPVVMPLVLAVYIGFFVVVNEPNGTMALVFSMVPFTSPIVMLMRIPFGVPFYQIIISLLILFGTFLGMVWLASKIYRVGILSYGKKPSWKDLAKWLKY